MVLVRREFVVNVPLDQAWEHLARVEQWPRWAKHILQVEFSPAGQLGPKSVGVIHLSNGLTTAFSMIEFNLLRNWKWAGRFLWLTIHYDHVFEPEGQQKTKLIWTVAAKGFGMSLLGRIFAVMYGRSLDRAIPLLVADLDPA